MKPRGWLALVLHAHLPFVRHPESDDYLEQRWFFEALTETYLPLLRVFQGLAADRVDFRLTLTLTPTLLSMLTDPWLQAKYREHIEQLLALADQEERRTRGDAPFHRLALHYAEQFEADRALFDRYNGNIVPAFAELEQSGHLELITCAATHAFLPLLATEQAARAQLETGIAVHERYIGRRPRGIWLPECGVRKGVDALLADCGLHFFFTDTHGLARTCPPVAPHNLTPVRTPAGVAAFARDPYSSQQVWSSQEGYPGDYDYREYYRDIGYDLDYDEIRAFLHRSGIRHNTGLKYLRITGPGGDKQPYQVEIARSRAADHAEHFLAARRRQVSAWRPDALAGWEPQRSGQLPIVTAPYDAELFGHWWYEGPQWIDFLFRKMHFDQTDVAPTTPSAYLQQVGAAALPERELDFSSWGRGGYADVWLGESNDWIYPVLHAGERTLISLAERFHSPDELQRRALNQAARELMLAQSSDWAFIMDAGTMVDYAVKRTKWHVNRLQVLTEMLTGGAIDESWLTELERIDNLFVDVDYQLYRPRGQQALAPLPPSALRPCALLLSWEYPPMMVGGLARHVYDLSRYLALAGWEIHVVTTRLAGSLADELVAGVHVHRVDVLQPDGGDFVHWAFLLNLALLERCDALLQTVQVAVVHAHDWLVCYTAEELKRRYGLPLVATIHATEHGRNQGIHTDTQRYIHHLEWQLTYAAERVILCSHYMQREVEQVFQLPADKLDVIPNGVDPALVAATGEAVGGNQAAAGRQTAVACPLVLFVGRLVREKGVQVLLDAVPNVLSEFAQTQFVILGTGPAAADLRDRAQRLGIADHVQFRGFVADDERNALLQGADVAVFPSLYEPFGIVALEAMAAGAPVVVSDIGGLADVVRHGETGRKAYAGDVLSLARQVRAALRDPDVSRAMAQRAATELSAYDWRCIAQRTIAVYEAVRSVPAVVTTTAEDQGEGGSR